VDAADAARAKDGDVGGVGGEHCGGDCGAFGQGDIY